MYALCSTPNQTTNSAHLPSDAAQQLRFVDVLLGEDVAGDDEKGVFAGAEVKDDVAVVAFHMADVAPGDEVRLHALVGEGEPDALVADDGGFLHDVPPSFGC